MKSAKLAPQAERFGLSCQKGDRHEQQKPETRIFHPRHPSGYDPLDYHSALNPPVFLTSTFAFDRAETGSERFAGEAQGYIYSRVGNPTVSVLESRMAELEEGEAALATSSGMGALTARLWTFLSAGDEIIADKTLYGCTFSLLRHHVGRFGIGPFCRSD